MDYETIADMRDEEGSQLFNISMATKLKRELKDFASRKGMAAGKIIEIAVLALLNNEELI